MVSRFIRTGLIVFTLLSLSALTLAPAVATAATDNITNGLCAGASLDATKAKGNCNPNDSNIGGESPDQRINDIISTIINIFSLIVGVVAVIMIIVGGLRYITSGGDSGNVTGAKNTILYAVIGLIVVALAQFIVRFVLSRVTGSGGGSP